MIPKNAAATPSTKVPKAMPGGGERLVELEDAVIRGEVVPDGEVEGDGRAPARGTEQDTAFILLRDCSALNRSKEGRHKLC